MLRLLLLTLLAVAGCASTTPALTVGAAPEEGSAPADPAGLLGWWRVEGTDEVLLLGAGTLEVVAPDRTVSGTWRADPAGRLVTQTDAVISEELGGATDPAAGKPVVPAGPADATPPWLVGVAGFRAEGADLVLLDRAGAQTARLQPTDPVPGSGTVDPAQPLTDTERRDFAEAAPAPAGAQPAGPAELAGRWVPEGATAPAFLEITEDGTWTGSDGCNGTGGSWVVGTDGGFLASASAISTLIACDGGADVAGQVGTARRAVLEGDVLVLTDVDGAVAGRYQRAG